MVPYLMFFLKNQIKRPQIDGIAFVNAENL